MLRAIYPGSFDPVTYGHIDIMRRSCKIVDELIVGVLSNKAKIPLFSVEERVKMLKEVTKDLDNIRIVPFDGLLVTPDEIKRYQKIIANRDAILADAQAKADAMIEEAQVQTTELVSEHEIMQQAYAQANEIVTQATAQAQEIIDNATSDANAIRIGAIQYTDDLMANAESIIGHTLDSYTTKYDGLISSLQECYETVRANRAELDIPTEEESGIYNSQDDLF